MWNDPDIPLAFFISFRAYGTWLHGDKRGSTDRHNNCYGEPHLPPNERWRAYNQKQLKSKPFRLGKKERRVVKAAIKETCEIRKWSLEAINVRSNHVHTVVSAGQKKADAVLNAFKANATRRLRETGLWNHTHSPWADKGSKRKLWSEESVADAVGYVLYEQGDEKADFDD